MDASANQAANMTGRCSDAELVACVAGAVRESVAAVSRRKGSGSWLNVAVDEAKERWKSEALNLELRHALEDQVRLADALRGLVQGHAAGQVWQSFTHVVVYHTIPSLMRLTFDLQCMLQSVLSALDKFQRRYPERAITSLSVDLISDLQVQVARQYLHVDTVIQPLAAYSASSTMQTKRDFSGQLVVEITTTTPVACSLHDAIKMLVTGMDSKHVQGQKIFLDVRYSLLSVVLRSAGFVTECADVWCVCLSRNTRVVTRRRSTMSWRSLRSDPSMQRPSRGGSSKATDS